MSSEDSSSTDEDYVPPSSSRRRRNRNRRLPDDDSGNELRNYNNSEADETESLLSVGNDDEEEEGEEGVGVDVSEAQSSRGRRGRRPQLRRNGNNITTADDDGTQRNVEDENSDDSESLPSIGDEDEGQNRGETENEEGGNDASFSQGPVSSFRVRVGPDGEEMFEFASDVEEEEASGSSDEGGHDPGWQERIGIEPAVAFEVAPDIIASIAQRLLTVPRRRASAAARNRASASTSRPASGSERRSRRRGQNPSRGRKRRKRKGAKKKVPKKPRAPPKPLGPLTIHENWNGNDDFKIYSKLISIKSNKHRVRIGIKETKTEVEVEDSQAEIIGSAEAEKKMEVELSESVPEIELQEIKKENPATTSESKPDTEPDPDDDDEATSSNSGYKITQIKFYRCSRHEWHWKNKAELAEAFPDIVDLVLHISSEPGGSILHLRARKTLEGDDVSQRVGPPLKLSKRDMRRSLIFVGTEHYFFHVDPPPEFPVELFSNRALGNQRTFAIDFNSFDEAEQSFLFDVILLESAIMGAHELNQIPPLRSPLMQEVFTNFLGVSHPPRLLDEAREKEDIEWFYGQIKKYHKQEQLPPSDIPLQPSSLKPTLRQYQKDAVHWMLYREGCLKHCEAHSSTTYTSRVNLVQSFLDKMYVPVELTKHSVGDSTSSVPEKKVAYYNLHTSYLCWSKPKISSHPSGGILCDEMGLGKTVETLCLILLNQKEIPEKLREYFENKGDQKSKEGEEEDDDEISVVSESEWESSSSDSSSSTDCGFRFASSNSAKKKPTKKKVKKSAHEVTKKKKTSNAEESFAPRFRNLKRRRALSPTEFTAAAGEESTQQNEDSVVEAPKRRRTSNSKRITASEYVEKTIKKNKRIRGGKDGSQKRPPLFEAMKVLYDSALHEYRFADYAKCTPKFHGKFYDLSLELRAFFECICGESEEGCEDWEIVKCGVCSSSQHAECVGLDADLVRLYQVLGRTYLCPHCEAVNPPFETKSTLIITPPSISHQWIKEIQRHVQNHRLNIMFYKGVSVHGYIPPAKLARYDVVITTYTVLSSELNYVGLPHCNSTDGRRFRNPKRFLTIPSPLPCVLWWRVVLDEAQMVEGINTKMSMMAMKLQAIHRWCVTGTPMNKGLQDLFGLFVFLNVEPINYDIWWNTLVRDAFFRKDTSLLFEMFGQFIWRNGKQDVLDQLGIPPQTERIHWLNFSPVETHFYKQQFEICSNKIIDKICRLRRNNPDILEARLSTLDRFSLNGLLSPFLELRQACCHPQIVKGQLISLQKGPLTMEDLLERLTKKALLQCIDDHRLIISALNGLAGLYIIRDNFKEAAEKYREVLQSAEKYKEHFQTDSLQLLHTIENLAEILDANHDGIPFTLRDESLRSDAAEVRKKYMKRYSDAVLAARNVVTPLTDAVDEVRSQFTMVKESWWLNALKSAERLQKIDGLIQTLKQDLMDVSKKNFHKTLSLANKFHDRYGLERILVKTLIEMDQLRNTVLDGLEELQTNEPSTFVESAIRCHLRQASNSYYNDGSSADKCKLCAYHDNFLFYESVIFKIESKDKVARTGRNYQQKKLLADVADSELPEELTDAMKEELLRQEAEDLKTTTEHVQLINDELRRGNWGDSETELILKGILRFARSATNKLSPEVIQNGQVHMKLFEALKKEFRFMRILWRQIYDQVSALDELSQATTRMIAMKEVPNQEQPSTSSRNLKQLKSGTAEKALKIQNIHVIAYHEVEPKMAQMRLDYATGQETLSLHLGQLLYLKTLKKNGYGKRGTINTDDCPICSNQLGKEWSVLRCGHSFCCDCVKKMCSNTLASFLCPLCRHSMKYADVSFVDTTRGDESLTDPGTSLSKSPSKVREIIGSHSTKVEAIVETLFDLQEKHPGEKCIIFSMWSDVLEIIAKALTQNDIKFSLLNQSGRQFHMNLDKFKEREDLQVLLMPLTFGAKGLNIIEATHVLLVEPILNLASELQAIGRVHRIGQTKPTYVHRFYIKRTIEEDLFKIMKGQDISDDSEGSLTVKDLQNLVNTTASNSK